MRLEQIAKEVEKRVKEKQDEIKNKDIIDIIETTKKEIA